MPDTPFIGRPTKLTRQLRLDALATDGTAPIQLTITWEGNRLRLGTGAVVRLATAKTGNK